jgi:hypothetical protein
MYFIENPFIDEKDNNIWCELERVSGKGMNFVGGSGRYCNRPNYIEWRVAGS